MAGSRGRWPGTGADNRWRLRSGRDLATLAPEICHAFELLMTGIIFQKKFNRF
jgi:hypothetical protein